MPEAKKRKGGLPGSDRQLREEVGRYFERCRAEETPPTPSGLALSLGVRTSTLGGDQLTDRQREIIDQAMQRIEANTMELMLTRGGVKGMESVLERVQENESENRARDEIRALPDEEIRKRLEKLLPRIRETVGEDYT